MMYNRLVLLQRSGESKKNLQYCLVVIFPDGGSNTVEVEETSVTIGRSPNATVCLNEESVSRQHCIVTPAHGRLLLVDQGSTNGTRVNGKKVKRARLSHGDSVEIGTTKLQVQARTLAKKSVQLEFDEETVESTVFRYFPLPHEQLAAIKKMITRFAICRSAESIGGVVAEISLDLFPAERAIVMAQDAAQLGTDGTVLALRRRGKRPITKVKLNKSVVKRVLASGRAERHIALSSETVEREMNLESRRPENPILCAPLRQRTETVGILYLDAPLMPDWVGSAESLELLSTIGDLTGMALGEGRREKFSRFEIKPAIPPHSEYIHDTAKLVAAEMMQNEMLNKAEVIDRLAELGKLTREQQTAVNELKLNLERRVEERAEVIEEQRIELAARLAELEHLQQTRAMMSRGLVHDIRNLVSALTANLSFVQMGVVGGSEEAISLEAANVCARRIISMAEDVLAVSRMEAGTFPVDAERCAVTSLFTEAVRRHRAQAREVGVTLEITLVPRNLDVQADPNVIGRVLDNLIDNGLRYARSGGVVRLAAHQTGLTAELLVIDSGPGIDPNQRDKIFDEGVTEDEKGMGRHHGIGLYFCRLAAEAHGGGIRVEGASGDNRFILSLPAVSDPSAVDSRTSEYLADVPTEVND